MQDRLTDINTVCNLLGCTSRTLRFYEQKGIVQSTTSPYNSRRQYSCEQIEKIKEVLVLRSLGLPIAKIRELQANNCPLAGAISARKAELVALIEEKVKEYHLLSEALMTLDDGGDIFAVESVDRSHLSAMQMGVVEQFTDAFLLQRYDWCFSCFSDDMKQQLSASALQKTIADTLKPLGKFLEKDKIEQDRDFHNIYFSYLKYENLGLYIKIVFLQEKIHGVWLNYYPYSKGK